MRVLTAQNIDKVENLKKQLLVLVQQKIPVGAY